MRLRTVAISAFLLLLLSSCSSETQKTMNDVVTNVKDQASNLRDKENPQVLSVKNGHSSDYPNKTIDEVFKNFFGDPTWKYFKAESGEDVVEFTGYMMYQETKVKARLQFLLKENDQFEIGALSFNDVPQSNLIKSQVLRVAFESSDKAEATATK